MAGEPRSLETYPMGLFLPANLMDCSVLAKRPQRTSCQDLQMRIMYADFDGFGDLPHKSSDLEMLRGLGLFKAYLRTTPQEGWPNICPRGLG